MDLLSVVLHEFGHGLGLGHDHAGEFGIMGAMFGAGTRVGLTSEHELGGQGLRAPSGLQARHGFRQ